MANNRYTERAHWLREQAACSCFPNGTTMLIDDTYADLVKKVIAKHGVAETAITDNGYNSMDHEQPRLVIADGECEVGLWVYGGEQDPNEGELLSITLYKPGQYEFEQGYTLGLNELSPNVIAYIYELGKRFDVGSVESYDGTGAMFSL